MLLQSVSLEATSVTVAASESTVSFRVLGELVGSSSITISSNDIFNVATKPVHVLGMF